MGSLIKKIVKAVKFAINVIMKAVLSAIKALKIDKVLHKAFSFIKKNFVTILVFIAVAIVCTMCAASMVIAAGFMEYKKREAERELKREQAKAEAEVQKQIAAGEAELDAQAKQVEKELEEHFQKMEEERYTSFTGGVFGSGGNFSEPPLYTPASYNDEPLAIETRLRSKPLSTLSIILGGAAIISTLFLISG